MCILMTRFVSWNNCDKYFFCETYWKEVFIFKRNGRTDFIHIKLKEKSVPHLNLLCVKIFHKKRNSSETSSLNNKELFYLLCSLIHSKLNFKGKQHFHMYLNRIIYHKHCVSYVHKNNSTGTNRYMPPLYEYK